MKDMHVGLAGLSAISCLTEAVKMNSDPEQKAVVRGRSALRSAHSASE